MQGKYWILTIRRADWQPFNALPANVAYVRGQCEIGANGFEHWQVLACFKKKVRMSAVKSTFANTAHVELSRSCAANEYVWKEETRIDGTQFELGELPFKRNNKHDWELVKRKAKEGLIDDIPGELYIKYYRTLKQIGMDHMSKPDNLDRCCGIWIHGPPGVGKSHYAREHYKDAYMKMCNKWWCGFQNEDNVLIDDLDLSHKCLGHHLKIWSDKYSFIAETKGYAVTIRPKTVIVTSNYTIEQIFGDDQALCEALNRRFYKIFIPIKLF